MKNFWYDGDDCFNLDNLKIIFPEAQDESSENFLFLKDNEFFEDLSKYFCFIPDEKGDVLLSDNQTIIATRLQLFIKAIESLINIPILKATIYQFHPSGDYLDPSGSYWNFCFIVLNKDEKKGIAITASALCTE